MKHFGSIALGSLIITIIEILRKSAENDSDDGAGKIIKVIMVCLLRCLEGILDYLSRLSYAYMSISGKSFCTSAKNGFFLNLKHCMKFYFA